MTMPKTLDRKRLGELLATIRESKELTQLEASRRLGISQATLSKIENGESEPSLSTWSKFSELYGLPYALPDKFIPRG